MAKHNITSTTLLLLASSCLFLLLGRLLYPELYLPTFSQVLLILLPLLFLSHSARVQGGLELHPVRFRRGHLVADHRCIIHLQDRAEFVQLLIVDELIYLLVGAEQLLVGGFVRIAEEQHSSFLGFRLGLSCSGGPEHQLPGGGGGVRLD